MKKKIMALALAVVLLTVIGFGSYMLFKDYKGFHVGHALISRSGEFIFVDESGSPTILSNQTWSSDPFKGITDGDKVLTVYGFVLTSYPGQSGAYLCFKLKDGTIDDVNKETVKELAELGWLKGEAPFEELTTDDIESIKITEFSCMEETNSVLLSKQEIKAILPYLNSLEFAHDEGEMVYGGGMKIEIELKNGEMKWFTTFAGYNTVVYENVCYTTIPTVGSLQDYITELLGNS